MKALCRKYLLAAIGYARRHKIRVGIGIILLLWYSLCLPRDLFPQGYATIVESSDGKLLGGKIAPDGQWRFPELDSVPHKLREAKPCLQTYAMDVPDVEAVPLPNK